MLRSIPGLACVVLIRVILQQAGPDPATSYYNANYIRSGDGKNPRAYIAAMGYVCLHSLRVHGDRNRIHPVNAQTLRLQTTCRWRCGLCSLGHWRAPQMPGGGWSKKTTLTPSS